jgi:hypothetical protein
MHGAPCFATVTRVDVLRPFVSRQRAPHGNIERCDLCGAPVGECHRHVLKRDPRALLCSCGPCAVLFADPAASGGRMQTVPERVLVDDSAPLPKAKWAALGVPVALAFVMYDSTRGRWLAFYPSPAGPVQAEVTSEAWERFASDLPLARQVRPDVEALLVRGEPATRAACLLAPIDECYAVVGAVRVPWRGLDGGEDVRRALDGFFERLRTRARPLDGGGESA